MSDKLIISIPLERIKAIQIAVTRGKQSLTQVAAQARAENPGCRVHVINGSIYNPSTQKAYCHLRADGYTWAEDPYTYAGYAWDSGADITMTSVPAAGKRSHIACVKLIREGKADPKPNYQSDMGGKRGRTAMAIKDGCLLLYVSRDGSKQAATPEALRDELAALGCESAIMLDGGGSSQCDMDGQTIKSSRNVHHYIVVCEHADAEGENPTMSEKPIVCLDPGHGVESAANQSPDSSFKEYLFTLELAQRIRPHLERCGVTVVLTREDEHCPTGKANDADLTRRAEISNQAGADLFVSLHTNAQSGTGWGSAKGLEIYTAGEPLTAKRNVAAVALLNRFHAAGVILRGDVPKYSAFAVLKRTSAPAVLIEYGFHTNQEDVALMKTNAYQDKLAEATAKGICDALGVAWVEDKQEDNSIDPVPNWAAVGWQAAYEKGVLDGTRPTDPVTRQELAVVLHRLGLV